MKIYTVTEMLGLILFMVTHDLLEDEATANILKPMEMEMIFIHKQVAGTKCRS